MLSSTKLNDLLNAKKFDEIEAVLKSHFKGENKLDIESSRKVTNLIAFQLANEKKLDMKLAEMLTKYFGEALGCLTESVPTSDVLTKVLDSCYHVVAKLSKEENESYPKMLLSLMPQIEAFAKKFKSSLEGHRVQEGFPQQLLILANRLRTLEAFSLMEAATSIYLKCASDEKLLNLSSGLMKVTKDTASILKQCVVTNKSKVVEFLVNSLKKVQGMARLPFLLLYMELVSNDGIQLPKCSEEIFDILINNFNSKSVPILTSHTNKFLYLSSTKAQSTNEATEAEKIIKMAIQVAEAIKVTTTPSLLAMHHVRYNINYDKKKDFEEAMKCAEAMEANCKSTNDINKAVRLFVNAKRKVAGAPAVLKQQILRPNNVEIIKMEMKVSREFKDFVENREILAQQLLKIATNDLDKAVAWIELAWVNFISKKNAEVGRKYCQNALKIVEKGPNNKELVHIKDLQEEVKAQKAVTASKKENRDAMLDLGDLGSLYSKIITLDKHESIMANFNISLDLINKIDFKIFKEDILVDKNDLEVIDDIITDILEFSDAKDDKKKSSKSRPFLVQDVIEAVRYLIESGHFKEASEAIDALLEDDNVKEESIEGRLDMAEVKLLQGSLFASKNGHHGLEGPIEVGWSACKLTASCLTNLDKNPLFDLEAVKLMFKALKLASEARQFTLKVMVRTGLTREMRMLAKLCIEAGTEAAFLPHLCRQILSAVEVDLICDDEKEAQVKIKEVENLLKDHLRSSESQKIKSKQSQNVKIVLPHEDEELLCASPYMSKMTFGLPKWLVQGQNKPLGDIVIMYFTYQAIVWHLQKDEEAMSMYFDIILEPTSKAKNITETKFTAIKWMIECYAHLEDYDTCQALLVKMKNILVLSKAGGQKGNYHYWLSVFKELAIYVSLAKNRPIMLQSDPSPIRPGSTLYEAAKIARTPLSTARPEMKAPKLRAKRAIPINSELDVKKLSEMKLDDDEVFKPPPTTACTVKKASRNSAIKKAAQKSTVKKGQNSAVKKVAAPKKCLEVYQDDADQEEVKRASRSGSRTRKI